MRTTRILFTDDESSDSVARRIVYAFNVGDIIKIRDSFFRVVSHKAIHSLNPNFVTDDYTWVLNVGDPLPEPKPLAPTTAADLNPDTKLTPEPEAAPEPLPETHHPTLIIPPPFSESHEEPETPPLSVAAVREEDPLPEESLRPPLETLPSPVSEPLQLLGQRWKSKDLRRPGVFTIIRVEGEMLYTNGGRTIAKSRLNRYERVL